MRLSELARAGEFIRVIEVFPPAIPSPKDDHDAPPQRFDLDLRFERLVQSVLRTEPVADAFSLPELRDGNKIHLNSIGLATELKRRTGSSVIPTITLRDSNKHGLLGSISFALFAGIENVLIVRGDPYPETGNNGGARNVYDYTKVSDLISMTRKIEKQVSSHSPLCILSPVNLAKSEDKTYLRTIKEREERGVDVFLAEQMFEEIDSYLGRIETLRKFGISKPIVHSIFPIKDYQDGLGLVQKFGWEIKDYELEKLRKEGPSYGLNLARQRYRELFRRRDLVQGVSVSTRGNPEVARYIFK